MTKIISIEGSTVKLGNDGGKVTKVPIASLTYSGAQVGDEVEVFKDGSDYIVNKLGRKPKSIKLPKKKISKKTMIICAGVIGGIALIVCAVIFLPKILDKDLGTASSYPNVFANLKEEKAAFSKALETCNKAATAQSKKGAEYNWDDIDAVKKNIYDYDGKQVIRLEDVNPTGGNTQRGSDKRSYDCYTTISGDSVEYLYISYDY